MSHRRFTSVAAIILSLLVAASTPYAQEGRIAPQSAIQPERIQRVPTAFEIKIKDRLGRQTATGKFVAIARAAERDGIFIADDAGTISLYEARPPYDQRKLVQDPEPVASFESWAQGVFDPRGLAIAGDKLYFFDGETRRLWTFDLWEAGEQKPQAFNTQLDNPSYMAVSADGVAAVTDSGDLLLLQEDREAFVFDGGRFPSPAGLMFSDWDTLHVLDKQLNAVVTITFNRTKDGRIRVLSEKQSVILPREDSQWQAMTVYDGVVYLADQERVYAYFESESKLVPVVSGWSRYYNINDIAVSDSGLYVLDGSALEFVPRAEPVDLVLDGDVTSSQNALLSLYEYLFRRDMLPTREVRARRQYDSVQDFLFQHGALIAPPEYAEQDVRYAYTQQRKSAYQAQGYELSQSDLRQQKLNRSEYRDGDIEFFVCTLNESQCKQSVVEQDTLLEIPDLTIERRLGRKRVQLRRPLGNTIADLVVDQRLRDAINPSVIKRFNRELRELDDAEIYALKSGTVVLPVEQWLVTIAVPRDEFETFDSELWSIVTSHDGADLLPRKAVSAKAKRSTMDHHDDPEPGSGTGSDSTTDHCAALREKHATWLKALNYPQDDAGKLIWPEIAQKRVRIGILEDESTVLETHQVFSLDPDRPTWHSFSDTFAMLVPTPDPQSFESGAQAVLDSEEYSGSANHGTHVSGIIAGRAGQCWSGLLPSARLTLIDLSDQSRMGRDIEKAFNEDVRVFNVSYSWPAAEETLFTEIGIFDDALWVVAAGNHGDNLDEMAVTSAPVPAAYGALPNVITVTASDNDGLILEHLETDDGSISGANRGKKYVDLVAPGVNIYSASEQKKYGPASGTSQATPQVAAAAALLVDWLGERMTPGDAKARLIATADWLPSYEGKVWGGRLNFGAAVMFPERSLLQTQTDAQLGRFHSISPDNNPRIQIVNLTRYYERDTNTGETAEEFIRFRNILSLRRQADGSYRVVLREKGTDKLKIILDAELAEVPAAFSSSKIECETYEIFDEESGDFVEDSGCSAGISVTQIQNYVQGGQYQIDWGSE